MRSDPHPGGRGLAGRAGPSGCVGAVRGPLLRRGLPTSASLTSTSFLFRSVPFGQDSKGRWHSLPWPSLPATS